MPNFGWKIEKKKAKKMIMACRREKENFVSWCASSEGDEKNGVPIQSKFYYSVVYSPKTKSPKFNKVNVVYYGHGGRRKGVLEVVEMNLHILLSTAILFREVVVTSGKVSVHTQPPRVRRTYGAIEERTARSIWNRRFFGAKMEALLTLTWWLGTYYLCSMRATT